MWIYTNVNVYTSFEVCGLTEAWFRLLSLITLFKLLFSIAFLCKYKADVRVQCLEYVSIIFSLYRKLMNDNVNSVYWTGFAF